MLWYVPGQGIVDDQQADIPEYGELALPDGEVLTWGVPGIERVPEYTLAYQFDTPVQWRGELGGITPQGVSETFPGYISTLLQWADAAEAGTLKDYERLQWEEMKQQALAVPRRDVSTLQFGYDPDPEGGVAPTEEQKTFLGFGSPDLGAQLLTMRERIKRGEATPHEQALFTKVKQMGEDWHYRATVPQESDAFSILGNDLTRVLAILGTGATAGLAAAPLAAGTAGLATTLGSIGSLAGTAGGWASTIGGATGQDWLQKLGLGLGVAGGLAGGIGGLSNVLGTGVQSVADAARLAQSAGKITGALGRIPGADPLKQASQVLNLAGTLGQAGSGTAGLLGAARGLSQGATQGVSPGGTGMAEWGDWGNTDWLDWSGGGQGPLLSDVAPAIDWSSFTAGGPGSTFGQFVTDWANGPTDTGGGSWGGGNWLSTVGGLAGGLGKFLGSNASWLGPAVSGLAGLGGGLIGSNASSDAAALQSQALNRALSLQEAQWLQTQANQAPWLAAGRDALAQLQARAGQGEPTLGQLGPISAQSYGMPQAQPGWQPSQYAGYTPTEVPSAAGYRYTPGQGPQAAQYRYTPGAVPDAGQYRYTPGAVPTLSGAELLANDPGYQFRMDEARRALEASAAARGGLTSGSTLSALQRQSQDLASQEYANAWGRAAQQAQMREQWGQTASQLGFGQAMSAAQLREQINQIASQQGWSQAQAEAAFREQLAQQASSQNWGQAAQEAQLRAQQQQFGWQAGFQGQQQGQREAQAYETDLYNRLMQQSQTAYGREWQQREAEYQRLVDQYNAARQGQNTAWNQYAALAGLGQTAVGQLGTQGQAAQTQLGSLLAQLGTAQGVGAAGEGLAWTRALGGAANNVTSLLAGLNR